jgi:hypothetical protein
VEQFVQKTRKLHKTIFSCKVKIQMITNSIRAITCPYCFNHGFLGLFLANRHWSTLDLRKKKCLIVDGESIKRWFILYTAFFRIFEGWDHCETPYRLSKSEFRSPFIWNYEIFLTQHPPLCSFYSIAITTNLLEINFCFQKRFRSLFRGVYTLSSIHVQASWIQIVYPKKIQTLILYTF